MAWPKGKPRPPTAGRRKGTPNKTTAAVRDMLRQAFDELGGVEYLIKCGKEDPRTFLTGLWRMVPNEVAAKVEARHVVELIDLAGGARERARSEAESDPDHDEGE